MTKAKEQVLSLLAEYFCLRTNDVAELMRNRELTETDKRSVRNTIKLLYQAGLVHRIKYVEQYRDIGNPTYVWGLNDKGVEYMSGIFNMAKTFDDHSERTLDHELEISLFHIALKRYCVAKGFGLYWQQADLKHTIHPDALFGITDYEKPPGQDTLYYFLEIERAKIGHYQDGEPSIMKKLGAMYRYYDSDLCEKEWETFRQYRVVVIQRTEMRMANLLRELNLKFNHRMFWLTTEDAYKRNIGGKIFNTPKDGVQHPYSFHKDE